MAAKSKYCPIRDSRERAGWDFRPSAYCLGTQVCGLPTGDYTLAGLEDHLIIERKGSTAELAKNAFEDRFERELERLSHFPQPFVVCEFTYDDVWDYPAHSGIPPNRCRTLRVRGPLLMKRLTEMQISFPSVRWALVGVRAKLYVEGLFKRFTEGRLGNATAGNDGR